MFPLEVFPERSLAESVITTVWVGVFVVSFFNLRLGWPFSGLVVPGYLVPLMIAKPAAAGVVCFEGFVTYFVIKYLCERFHGSGIWSSFFGRDRFFALIVASLLVRLVLDGWFFPSVGEFVNRYLRISFDYRNNLSSFGLIIVALIANQFWKTGFVRGQIPFWITIGITFLIIRYGLMVFTNFNIGNLEYMYENISASLVASPKAYIVLLTCAFVASRMNLLYGWDFNGILIPSLLALEWYHPSKVLFTFVEAFVILGGAVLVLKTPIFRQMTVEGARKLLLFFNVSFVYKLILGHIQQASDMQLQMTDYFGYGYLVPTLIAVKMHDKHIPLRLTRATLQTSFAGAVIASVLGFGLTFLPQPGRHRVATAEMAEVAELVGPSMSLAEIVRMDKLGLYRRRTDSTFTVPLPHETDAFLFALRNIERHLRLGDPELLAQARSSLAQIGYEALVIEDRYLYLRESAEMRGWGIYAFDLERTEGSVVEVPSPVDEWGVLETGAFLFDLFDARALAIGGASRRASRDGSSDVLRSGRTFFSMFHRTVAREDVIQVRGYGRRSMAEFTRMEDQEAELGPEDPRSVLWIERSIPDGLSLPVLRDLLTTFSVRWGRTPYANLQREETRGGFCELVLGREDRRTLLSLSVVEDRGTSRTAELSNVEGHLRDWLLERAEEVCPRGSELYLPPRVEEILLFDEEVITPIITVWRESLVDAEVTEEHLPDLRVAQAYARLFGYEIGLFHDLTSDGRFIVLWEPVAASRRRCWGTFVWRLADAGPYVVQVPRPGLEENGQEFGTHLFFRLRGQLLAVGGSHPWANPDGSADLVRSSNRTSILGLVAQAQVREAAEEDLMILQCRGFGFGDEDSSPPDDVLLSLGDGCTRPACFSQLTATLHEALVGDDLSVRVVAGDRDTAGYEAYGSTQAHYASLYDDKEFCALWLSPFLRSAFESQSSESPESQRFAAVGIPTTVEDLYARLDRESRAALGEDIPAERIESVERYVAHRDVVALEHVLLGGGWTRLERLVDRDTRRSYLLAWPAADRAPVVFRLAGHGSERVVRTSPTFDRSAVEEFKRSLARRLEVREGDS